MSTLKSYSLIHDLEVSLVENGGASHCSSRLIEAILMNSV